MQTDRLFGVPTPPHPDDLDGLDDHDRDRCRDMDSNRPWYPPPGDPADAATRPAGRLRGGP